LDLFNTDINKPTIRCRECGIWHPIVRYPQIDILGGKQPVSSSLNKRFGFLNRYSNRANDVNIYKFDYVFFIVVHIFFCILYF